MKKIFYRKLVRDKIPAVIRKHGGAYRIQRLSPKKFQYELLRKVGEEASALPRLRQRDEIASELGDVLDVIAQLQTTFKISNTAIRTSRRQAMKRKGGFRTRTFLVWAEDTGYRTNERRNVRRTSSK